MNEQLVQPPPPDELTKETREFWREVGRTMVRESIASIDETAKQIIGVTGVLEGLYFHAIAYTDLRGQVTGGELAVYLAPLVLLLFSLVAALLVFFPDRYRVNVHSSEGSRKTYESVVSRKLQCLRIASVCLILGVAALVLALAIYLGG
jgi:uncharacterized membrane protein